MRRHVVGCIRRDRIGFDQIGRGPRAIRPDVAVEVVSPNDLTHDFGAKLDDDKLAGIPLVWLVAPPSRRVRVIRPDGPPTNLGPDDALTGEHLQTGFRCQVAESFGGPA